MITIMYWVPKNELRVVRSGPRGPWDHAAEEYRFLTSTERAAVGDTGPYPRFPTEAAAWAFIATRYPHLAP